MVFRRIAPNVAGTESLIKSFAGKGLQNCLCHHQNETGVFFRLARHQDIPGGKPGNA